MSNSSFNGRRFTIDGRGVIYTKPLWISKLLLKPNAAGDSITLASWSENGTPHSAYDLKTVGVTSASILTATGTADLFVAGNVTALDVINITSSTTAANVGYTLVLSQDGDEIITTIGKTLTNDTSQTYSWKIWTPTTEGVFTCDAATGAKAEVEWDFGRPGLWFPNLAVTGLTASATAQIFLG